MRHRAFMAAVAVSIAAVPMGASAQVGVAAVNSMMSTYLAGGNSYTTSPVQGGGTAPFFIALDPGLGRILTVIATGTASFCPGGLCVAATPDGPAIGNTTLNPSGKISGIDAVSSGFLAGVFYGAASPVTAPASLNFTDLDFLTLSPLLGQQFFIGNGSTSGSITQQFFVPDGAEFLALGIADGSGFNGDPGFYEDNVGTYTANYSITGTTSTPEPGSLMLLATGIAGVAALRRKRSAAT